ncbi:MAG: hypothetical protein HYV65_00840 [Candidatus Spechtbacteria bacterium]|nr:hypothetical protein [Candidatus Spechtbacteria bacterium]
MLVAAKQNQKFPFHFFFRFAAEGWGEEARGKCKEIFWFLHTRVRERVRGACAKWVRAKANTSPQKETSESERWEEARAEGAGVGKRARRFATNWDGTGAVKWADLSLFHI